MYSMTLKVQGQNLIRLHQVPTGRTDTISTSVVDRLASTGGPEKQFQGELVLRPPLTKARSETTRYDTLHAC